MNSPTCSQCDCVKGCSANLSPCPILVAECIAIGQVSAAQIEAHRVPDAAIVQPAPSAQSEPAQMQRDTIRNMATAAHAIDFWDEYFDYVNSDPTAHSDMVQIARLLRNPSEEIARLRGEIGVMCGLMDRALDVMQTVNGDDDGEDRKILRLRAKMASAIDHFRGAELLPATAQPKDKP